MTTTEEALDLRALLDEVNRATVVLRAADAVPGEVEALVGGLDATLHVEAPQRLDADPFLAAALFAGVARCLGALRRPDPAVCRRELRVALEQVRHALRDIVDGEAAGSRGPAKEVLLGLSRSLAVPQHELAGLLGVSTRQLQRWLAPSGSSPGPLEEARIRLLAELAAQLSHTFTPPGVVAWLRRSHPVLGGSPLELLADPLRHPDLVTQARAARTAPG